MAVGTVLRDAVLRSGRRPMVLTALAVAFSVLPDLFASPIADALKGSLPAAAPGSVAADGMDLLRSLIDLAAAALLVLGGLLLDIAVVLLSLGADGGARARHHRFAPRPFRTAPLIAVTFVMAFAWSAAAPERFFVPGAGLISLWILPLTVVAAEELPLSRVLPRLRALTRGRRRSIAGLVGVYLAVYIALNEADMDLPTPFAGGSIAAWTVDALEASLVAALAILAGATAAALYRALLGAEGPPPATLAAFD